MQQRRKGSPGREGRTLSTPMLVSVYVACAAILGLCIYQMLTVPDRPWLYLALCVAAAGYTVFITVMHIRNRKRDKARAPQKKR